MNSSLNDLFLCLANDTNPVYGSEDLFGFTEASFTCQDSPALSRRYCQADIELVAAVCSGRFNPSLLNEPARGFYELSESAFYNFINAWMSELPIEVEMLKFGRRVIAAGEGASGGIAARQQAAERAASDHGDADTIVVMNAAYKVFHEVHRMMGFLRFSPDNTGAFIARCTPDHLILPALGNYFTARFGETAAWSIIDEKRSLCLSRRTGEQVKIAGYYIEDFAVLKAESGGKNADEWEELWRHYHKTINNESRSNPNLQRQLMPKRYWKYLPEISS